MAESAWANYTPTASTKKKDQGFLADTLGSVADFISEKSPAGAVAGMLGKDIVSQEDAAANIRGVTDFVSPGTLFPAVAGATRDTIRALPTAMVMGTGRLTGQEAPETIEDMKASPLSFLFDAANIEKQQALANSGNEGLTGAADKFNAMLGTVLPVGRQLQEGFAKTGLRGGAMVGSGLSQATGDKKSIDEASDMLNVQSYGQAAQEGQGLATLLGDVLNVAPALKGATAGGALNPLADTAAAAKVAKFGGALEAAPLAPISVPGKGIMTAVDRASGGAVAFPNAARAVENIPGARGAVAGAEGAAQWFGKGKTGHEMRSLLIENEARVNKEIKASGEYDELIAQRDNAVKTGADEAAIAYQAQLDDLLNEGKREATNEAIFEMTRRGEAKAKKYGGETVASDAYARMIDPETGELIRPGMFDQQQGLPSTAPLVNVEEYVSPLGQRLSDFEGSAAPMAETLPRLPTIEPGVSAETLAKMKAGSAEQVIAEAQLPGTFPVQDFGDYLSPGGRRLSEFDDASRPMFDPRTPGRWDAPALASQEDLFRQGAEPGVSMNALIQGSQFPEGAGISQPSLGGLAPEAPSAYVSPRGQVIESFEGSAAPMMGDLPKAALPKGISEEAINRASTEQALSPANMGFEGIQQAADDYVGAIKAGLKDADKLPNVGAVRQIPKGWTEESISAHLRGLDAPAMPKGEMAAGAVAGWDKMMTAWKTSVLPARPAWHTGNATGNAMSAMLLGEVSPIWYAKNVKQIVKEMNDPNLIDAGLLPSMGRGISAEVPASVRSAGEGAVKKWMKDRLEGSWSKAQTVDDHAHYVVAKNRLDKNLANGMSREAAYADANAFSLKSQGDFGNMNGYERAFIRRIMPFYPWAKHQAKTTLRFPVENPARFLQSQAWAQRLEPGQGQAPGQGADFLKGMANLGGGQFLRAGGDIGLGFESNPVLNPTQILGGLAPPLQAAGALAGFDFGRGSMLPESPGQNKASQVGGYLTNQIAPARLLADLVDSAKGEGNVARNPTRGAMVSAGRPIKDTRQGIGFLPPELLSYLTGATVNAPDLKSMTKRAKTAEKTQKSKEKSYSTAVKKQPK